MSNKKPTSETSTANSTKIDVKVITRASHNAVEKVTDSQYRVRVTTPPIKGKANKQVIKLICRYFAVKPKDVILVKGLTGHNKQILINKPAK